MTEQSFINVDGQRIVYHVWEPTRAPRAVVVINHGVNSHGGQYAWAGQKFAEAGHAVYAIDMRGRGLSEGPRFLVDDIADYVSDIDQLIDIAKSGNPGLPILLLGHSAGGVVATTYALEHQEKLTALVCESFAFRVPAPAFLLRLLQWLKPVIPGVPILKLKNKDFTRDPVALAALESDPLIRGEVQPVATVAALAAADERLERDFGQITLPVLILHGTADKATLYQGSEMFHRDAGSADKTLNLYPGHAHDLLNDIGKETVMTDILEWIDQRLPQAATA